MNRRTFAIIAALGISITNYSIAFDIEKGTDNFGHNKPELISKSCAPLNGTLEDQIITSSTMSCLKKNYSNEFGNLQDLDNRLNVTANCLQVCVTLSDGTQGRCFTRCLPFYQG